MVRVKRAREERIPKTEVFILAERIGNEDRDRVLRVKEVVTVKN